MMEAGREKNMRQVREDKAMNRENAPFDPLLEVQQIRDYRAEARRKLYRRSRLDKYRAELVAMRKAGASCADLVVWLRINRRCRINRSTIDRYLKKLPEMQQTFPYAVGQVAMPLSEEDR